ncbi:unnamed protein product, partial [Lampetra planeri]
PGASRRCFQRKYDRPEGDRWLREVHMFAQAQQPSLGGNAAAAKPSDASDRTPSARAALSSSQNAAVALELPLSFALPPPSVIVDDAACLRPSLRLNEATQIKRVDFGSRVD